MKVISPFTLVGIYVLLFLSSCIEQQTDPQLAFQEQWKKDTTAIGVHLRSNKIKALTDASGVRFVIDSLVEGFAAKAGSTVSFKYTGKFLSGAVFDQGSINSTPIGNFINGFQIALSLLPKGSKGRFYIPSGYAYGESGSGSIPENSNLLFEIQLTDLVTTETEKAKLASDIVTIDDYLAKNSIDAIRDKSGLRYVITELGAGAKPTPYTKVKINFTGKILDDVIFFNESGEPSSEFDSRVINYFYAFQAGLPKLPVGSKAKFYVPSGLGFGAQKFTIGTTTIPANSNIIYDIELLSIEN